MGQPTLPIQTGTMSLSHLETTALRLAIARNDNAIKAALDSFRNSLNENELKDNLRTYIHDSD